MVAMCVAMAPAFSCSTPAAAVECWGVQRVGPICTKFAQLHYWPQSCMWLSSSQWDQCIVAFQFHTKSGGGEWGNRRGGKTLFLKAALNSFLVTAAVLGIPVSCWKMFLYRAPGLTLSPFWAAPDESSGERKQDKKTSSHMLQNDLRQHKKSETLIYHSCIREKGSEGGREGMRGWWTRGALVEISKTQGERTGTTTSKQSRCSTFKF